METSLKIALGIVLGALAIGLVGYQASAVNGSGFGGMGGMMGFGHHGRGFGMMGAFANGTVNGTFDTFTLESKEMRGISEMNAMHKLIHGEDADVDMNQMHARMLAGNLTQEDFKEMKEHCPMMG